MHALSAVISQISHPDSNTRRGILAPKHSRLTRDLCFVSYPPSPTTEHGSATPNRDGSITGMHRSRAWINETKRRHKLCVAEGITNHMRASLPGIRFQRLQHTLFVWLLGGDGPPKTNPSCIGHQSHLSKPRECSAPLGATP